MNDNLENRIKENLSDFDIIESLDSELMWSDLDRRRITISKETKLKKISFRWYAAASIVILLTSGIIYQGQQSKHKNLIVNNLESIDIGLSQYQESLVNSMNTYQSTLNALNIKMEEHPDIMESLDQVERLAKSYQDDMIKYGPEPKIIKAILKCAKQKVELYEMLLYQLEIKSYHEKKSTVFKI